MSPPRQQLSISVPVAMLFIAGLMVALIAFVCYASAGSHDQATAQLSVARQVRNTTSQLVALVADAETGQRGFLITGRDSYLEPYNRAIVAVPALLQRLDDLTRLGNHQAERAAALRPVVNEKLAELARTIEVRREQGFGAAQDIVETNRGRDLMRQIRSECLAIGDDADGQVTVFSAAAEASDGRLREVSIVGSLLLLGFLMFSSVAIFRSLKLRDRLYSEAATSAERFRVTLASIGDAVIATTADQKITFMNAVAENLTGWTEAEALGRPISEVFHVVHETTRVPVANPLERALSAGAVVGLANHTVLIAKNGNEVPIDDSGAPIRDRNNAIQGAILVFRDISTRRQTERRLKESNEHLREFAHAAAHDLRSPLRSVNNFAQLLARRFSSELSTDGQNYLRFITDGISRMSQLLEGLLNYAQASNFEPADPPDVPMEASLRTAIENLREEIEANHAAITVDALPIVPVFEAHLVQLFQNLIGNAVKYHSDLPPQIQVSCRPLPTGWQLQVRDNGVGIDPSYCEEIFKPFKRLHGHDLPGSGIGLATCQKIVSGYGGRIWVESVPGRGSTFYFTIPTANHASATAGD